MGTLNNKHIIHSVNVKNKGNNFWLNVEVLTVSLISLTGQSNYGKSQKTGGRGGYRPY